MTALFIVLGVLLFLFLLLLCPVSFDVGFRQEFSLTLRYLFLRIRLLPGKEKPKEEKKEEPSKKKKEGEGSLEKLKAILHSMGFSGFLDSLFQLARMAANTGKNIIASMKWRRFDLYLCVGGKEDAAAAATLYGQLSGAVYSACGVLFGMTNCKRKAVTVDLDYSAPENLVDFSARVSVRPLSVLKEGLSLLIKGFPVLRKLLGAGGPKTKLKGKVSVNE